MKKRKTNKEQDEYKPKYLRALADYQNLEKRIQDEKEKQSANAVRHFILKILPFLDNLEKAEIFYKDPGLKIVKDQFWQVLTDEGVEELNLGGNEFDPHFAEAVEIVPGERDNIILEVIRKGYKLGDRILRPAHVKVSRKVPSEVEV